MIADLVTTITNINILKNGVIKSIQRGTVSYQSTVSVPISSVTASKCLVILTGATGVSSATSAAYNNFGYVTSLSATSLSLGSSPGVGSTGILTTGTVAWQVVEFY